MIFNTVQVADITNNHDHNRNSSFNNVTDRSTRPTQSYQSIDNGNGIPRPRASISAGGNLHDMNHANINAPRSVQFHTTPSAHSSGSQQLPAQASCFGETGYMQILSQTNGVEEYQVASGQLPTDHANVDAVSSSLQESFLETYFEYCFVWCPVLDHQFLNSQSDVTGSPLLRQALALCGNRINPPLIQYKDSVAYYNRAKELFYGNHEGNAILRLASIMLFFWWSIGATNLLNMDNAWWWTGVAIRIAHESGLHREPQPHQLIRTGETAGLRRRIWWTLFARDRILSISQGRPTIIDQDFCDVKMVTPQDFPDPTNPKVEIFINWIRLLDISGRISKQLSMKQEDRTDTICYSQDLISWIRALPETLSLPISTVRTTAFDRDVHRLYLTYLTNITLLHLSKSSQLLPKAAKAAIIAASCIARLLEDFLTRGSIRFLSGDAGWEIAVALLALLHARRVEGLESYAEADIRTLRTALMQMALLWPSSRMFTSAFDKLLGPDQGSANLVQNLLVGVEDDEEDTVMLNPTNGAVDWMDYFPFVTAQTSPLINAVLARNLAMPFTGPEWPMDINATLQGFLSLPDDHDFDIFSL